MWVTGSKSFTIISAVSATHSNRWFYTWTIHLFFTSAAANAEEIKSDSESIVFKAYHRHHTLSYTKYYICSTMAFFKFTCYKKISKALIFPTIETESSRSAPQPNHLPNFCHIHEHNKDSEGDSIDLYTLMEIPKCLLWWIWSHFFHFAFDCEKYAFWICWFVIV